MTFDELLTELKIDQEYTLARFSGMKALLERLLLKFLDDSSMQHLEQALSASEKDIAERSAHTLKGLASNLGLDELSRRASRCVDSIRSGDLEAARQQYPHISEEYIRIVTILKSYTNICS